MSGLPHLAREHCDPGVSPLGGGLTPEEPFVAGTPDRTDQCRKFTQRQNVNCAIVRLQEVLIASGYFLSYSCVYS